MSYSVKEIYYTLQGEGANTGRAAVFCRFTGCNLWSGREEDRATAICQFCDTDFIGTDGPGGGRFPSANDLARAVAAEWRAPKNQLVRPLVVCTGGEPLLQLDEDLVSAFHNQGFEVAVETNGTRPCPHGVDWVCLSPKAGTDLVIRSGQELKLIYPQEGAEPEMYEGLDFKHFFLQPMDGPAQKVNTELAVKYCLDHPQWRLSLQAHKLIGIP
jgi:7-carboxy-7-deazaguanine synthase